MHKVFQRILGRTCNGQCKSRRRGASGKNLSRDEQIIDRAKGHMQTLYNASFTGKAWKLEDPMVVTDSGAGITGVDGLRVVDASTFPLLPPGHLQSTICKFPRQWSIAASKNNF